jgi:hypothetical protein
MVDDDEDIDPVVARVELAQAFPARRLHAESDFDLIRRLGLVLGLAAKKVGIEPGTSYDFARLGRQILVAAQNMPIPDDEYFRIYRIWAIFSAARKLRLPRPLLLISMTDPRQAPTLEEAAANQRGRSSA